MVTRRSRKPVNMDICVQTETAAQPLFASEDSADCVSRLRFSLPFPISLQMVCVEHCLCSTWLPSHLHTQHMLTHLLLLRRLWTALWASQKRAGSASCQGVWGPVRPCKSWDNLPLTLLHTNCCYTASVTNTNMQLAQGGPPSQWSAHCQNTVPAPPRMARHCRVGHQALGRGCCLVSPLPQLSWVFPCCSVTTDSTNRGLQKYTEMLPLVTWPFCDKRDKRA